MRRDSNTGDESDFILFNIAFDTKPVYNAHVTARERRTGYNSPSEAEPTATLPQKERAGALSGMESKPPQSEDVADRT